MGGHLGRSDVLTDVLTVGEHNRTVRVYRDIEMVIGEELPHRLGNLLLINLRGVKVNALMQAPPCACAIHGSSIKVCETEMSGQFLRRR